MFNIFKRSKGATNPPVGLESNPANADSIPPIENPAQPASPATADQPAVETLEDLTPSRPADGAAVMPPSASDQVEPPAPPAARKSFLYYLFSPEHRFGRVFRVSLRWLAAITGLFTLGLLAGYLLLYQPTLQELSNTQVRLVQATQAAALSNKGQQSALADKEQALKSLQSAQADLKKAASQNSLLVVLVEVQNARVALVNKDGATAKTNIELAQADLTKVLPFLRSQEPARADVLQPRLDLAARELISDPVAAQSDLDKLASDLTDLHKKLFSP